MKKVIAFLLALTMLFALCACGSEPEATTKEAEQTAPTEGETEQSAFSEEERQIADVFDYATIEGEDNMVYGYIFEEDVTVNGDNGRVIFANCEFKKNIYNCGGEGAIVMLDDACIFSDSSECVINSALEDAGIDTTLPKFMYFCPGVKVTCKGCGAAVTYAEIPIVFNGETFEISDAEYLTDDVGSKFEPYDGQDATIHNHCQYYENGELVVMDIAVQAEI